MSDEDDQELRRKAGLGDESARKKLAASLERRGERFFAICQAVGDPPEGFESGVLEVGSSTVNVMARKVATLDELLVKRDRPVMVWDAGLRTTFVLSTNAEQATAVRFGERATAPQEVPGRIILSAAESALVTLARDRRDRVLSESRDEIERGQRAVAEVGRANAMLQQCVLGFFATRGFKDPMCELEIQPQSDGLVHLVRRGAEASQEEPRVEAVEAAPEEVEDVPF